jgi:hypothetical protein
LGLGAWYKYASEYGESYTRPVLWLLCVLVLFTFIFPLWGLRPSAEAPLSIRAPSSSSVAVARSPTPTLSYINYVRYASTEPGGLPLNFWSLLGHSFLTTLDLAAFQRNLEYEPTYPWGKLSGVLEILATSTLVALFLLAIRRQYRR